MRNCRNCGQEIDDNAIFCYRCGARTNGDDPRRAYTFNPYDGGFGYVDTKGSKLVTVLSFIFWQVGIVLWFIWRRVRPAKADSALKGVVGGVCFQLPVLGLLLWLLMRKDSRYSSFVRFGAISAIVGAALSFVSSILFGILKYYGVFDFDQYMMDLMNNLYATFIYSGLLG